MTYSPSTNPPHLLMAPIAGLKTTAGPQIWLYTSADTNATVDTSGYFSDGGKRGMKVGDVVIVTYTVTPIVKSHYVISVNATTGAVDLSDGVTLVDGSANTD